MKEIMVKQLDAAEKLLAEVAKKEAQYKSRS